MTGILSIDKPRGFSSHQVVQMVRHASGERRVGHCGTLDPLATGVLVLCLGAATRVAADVQAGRKTYTARVRLGIATTTYDSEGDVVAERDASGVGREDIERALAAFRGNILQVPPMHSALKVDGRPLYRLAREGLEVERPPRPVNVERLVVTAWEPPDVTLAMTVSSGTYVRSLAHDLGEALGTGAMLAALTRTAVGRFALENAEPLDRAIRALKEGWWDQVLEPIDVALLDYPAVVLDSSAEDDIRNGRSAILSGVPGNANLMARAYGARGDLVAVVRWDPDRASWRADRVFKPGQNAS